MSYWISRIISLGFILYAAMGYTWAQCASCKAAAATRDENGELVVGGNLNLGILYLLSLPFLLMGFILLKWHLKRRELAKEQ